LSFNYKHGGVVKKSSEVPGVANTRSIDVSQPFNYMFPELARDATALLSADDPASTISKLKDLGDAMGDNNAPGDDWTTDRP